jgi:hypothetical protein
MFLESLWGRDSSRPEGHTRQFLYKILYNSEVNEPPKPVRWIGDSLKGVRAFPVTVRQHPGFQLELVQHGMEPTNWKPMSTVGLRVREI